MNLQILPIKTRPVLPPQDDITDIVNHLPKLKEGDVLVMASKIIAIHQGRTVKKSKFKNQKSKLIHAESDYSLPQYKIADSNIILTIKDHTLIPSAGIDESNGNNYYILWPKNSHTQAKKIWTLLKQKNNIKNLGVIIADSHTTPLRWGTQGIAIGFFGLHPLKDYRGKKDIFGRQLKYTQSNIVDALANLGVLIPSAGIDESNGNNYYILWPKNSHTQAKKTWTLLKQKNNIKNLGVIIADSHTTPLRWGTQGIAIGFFGLHPLKDYRGKKDIFGRKLKYTQSNIVDALANLGVLMMGEGDEQTPMVIIRGYNNLRFTNQDLRKKFLIHPKQDLYSPLLKIFKPKHT